MRIASHSALSPYQNLISKASTKASNAGGERKGHLGCSGDAQAEAPGYVSPGKSVSLKVVHLLRILGSGERGNPPASNLGGHVLTPLGGRKSCQESWRGRLYLAARGGRQGGVRFPRNKGAPGRPAKQLSGGFFPNRRRPPSQGKSPEPARCADFHRGVPSPAIGAARAPLAGEPRAWRQ